MDTHLASATDRARVGLLREMPGLHLSMQGRYGIPVFAFQRWNGSYIPKLLAASISAKKNRRGFDAHGRRLRNCQRKGKL